MVIPFIFISFIFPHSKSSLIEIRERMETPRLAFIASLIAAFEPKTATVFSCPLQPFLSQNFSIEVLVPEPFSRLKKGSFTNVFKETLAASLLIGAAKTNWSSTKGENLRFLEAVFVPTIPIRTS